MTAVGRSAVGWSQDAPARPRRQRPPDASMMAVIARIADETGVPAMRIMSDAAALSFGPGRVSFADFVRLRLFDEAFWADSDRRAVVGRRRAREIAAQINGPAAAGPWANPLAVNAYLGAVGFTVPEVLAIFALDLAAPGRTLLRTREQLRDFLHAHKDTALSGRPLQGALGEATASARRGSDIDAAIDHIVDNHAAGFIFERRPAPHPLAAALTGAGAGRLRLITVVTDQGPKLLRAAWLAPDGRGRDIALRLDARVGVVDDAQAGEGLDLRWLEHHPVTGKPLVGRKVPDWSQARAMVSEASRLLAPLGLIGWDVALTPDGPMILGADPNPDLSGHQLIDRRGVLNPEFQAFIAARREDAALIDQFAKAEL